MKVAHHQIQRDYSQKHYCLINILLHLSTTLNILDERIIEKDHDH